MKLLAFSDLHQNHEAGRSLVERSGDYDVVIAAGDFANQHRGLEPTIETLSAIETPTLLVPGNNETADALRAACSGWDAATVLHGEAAEVDGTQFFGLGGGIPVTPWDWSFDVPDERAAELLAGAPEGGVLILHSPPKGHVDDGLGSEAILAAIEQKQPELAVCGHIHQCWGQESRVGSTLVRNLGPDGADLSV